MGFILTKLEIRNFRNHQRFELYPDAQNVLLVGPNAAGKSSILEAIQLLSDLQSFRTNNWQELVQTGASNACLNAVFQGDERQLDVQLSVIAGQRHYLFNGKSRRPNRLNLEIPTVLFTPEDLNLVKGPAEQRRQILDELGRKLSRQYQQIDQDYHKILKQRNAYLKDLQKNHRYGPTATAEETSWNSQLARLGAQLLILRFRLYQRFTPVVARYYHKLAAAETLTSRYTPSFCQEESQCWEQSAQAEALDPIDLQECLLCNMAALREAELARGISLVGPQRDDMRFFLNDQEARSYASQGQQRSIALAVKMAEVDLLRDLGGQGAILLLDDVLSELDASRRAHLLDLSRSVSQCFITTTDISIIPASYRQQTMLVELPSIPAAPATDPAAGFSVKAAVSEISAVE